MALTLRVINPEEMSHGGGLGGPVSKYPEFCILGCQIGAHFYQAWNASTKKSKHNPLSGRGCRLPQRPERMYSMQEHFIACFVCMCRPPSACCVLFMKRTPTVCFVVFHRHLSHKQLCADVPALAALAVVLDSSSYEDTHTGQPGLGHAFEPGLPGQDF